MLEPTALDAFIAGLSTAFFGALVAGGAYLLREHIRLREQLEGLRTQVLALEPMKRMLSGSRENLKGGAIASESDDADA